MEQIHGYRLKGREIVCPECYRAGLDAVAEVFYASQGTDTLWCDNCLGIVQDGPSLPPEDPHDTTAERMGDR